jgi:hypothetical protein
MNAVFETLFPTCAIFCAGFGLTVASLWLAGRLAPWFLKEAVQPLPVKSYFTDLWADTDMTRMRAVTGVIALALALFAVLTLAIFAHLIGWQPGAM